MTIEKWAEDFKSYVYKLQLFQDDYKGIIEYIDEGLVLLKEREPILLENQHRRGGHVINANSPWISKCPKCGKKIEGKQTKFCKYCGRSVKWK